MLEAPCVCWLVAFAGVIVLGSIAAGISSAIRNRGIIPREFHCPQCRYNLHGITRPQCPECGCQLTVQGVRTANDDPPMGLGTRLAMWTVFYLGPAMVMIGIATMILPPLTEREQFKWTAQGHHDATGFLMTATTDMLGSGESPTELQVTFSLGESPLQKFVVSTRDLPDAAAIAARLQWFQPLAKAHDAAAIAEDICTLLSTSRDIRALLATPYTIGSAIDVDLSVLRGSSHYSSFPPASRDGLLSTLGVACFALVAGLWIAGCMWISRDYERAMAEYTKRLNSIRDGFLRSVEAAAKASAGDKQS